MSVLPANQTFACHLTIHSIDLLERLILYPILPQSTVPSKDPIEPVAL